jgi:hypothetical protein
VPEYWEPRFLFGLQRTLGFGIEDVVFVTVLGAWTAVAYPAASGLAYAPRNSPRTVALKRGAALVFVALVSFGGLLAATVPAIVACAVSMGVVLGAVATVRPDLMRAMLSSGVVTGCVYGLSCLALGALVPDVFVEHWRTSRIGGGTLLGVPVWEWLYGVLAGASGAAFYAVVYDIEAVPRCARVSGACPP